MLQIAPFSAPLAFRRTYRNNYYGHNPQYFKQGAAATLSLHICQNVSSVLQSTVGLSWQTGVVVPKLVEPVVNVGDVVTGEDEFVLNKLVVVTDEVVDDEDEFEVTLGDDEAAGDMVTAVDETK